MTDIEPLVATLEQLRLEVRTLRLSIDMLRKVLERGDASGEDWRG